MSQDIDAVIAALRVALSEAQQSAALWWRVEASNRWIRQLPGWWAGRWGNLILQGDILGEVPRQEFIGHVRATISFLKPSGLTSMRREVGGGLWFPRKMPQPTSSEPVEAEFVEVEPAPSDRSSKSRRSVRLIK